MLQSATEMLLESSPIEFDQKQFEATLEAVRESVMKGYYADMDGEGFDWLRLFENTAAGTSQNLLFNLGMRGLIDLASKLHARGAMERFVSTIDVLDGTQDLSETLEVISRAFESSGGANFWNALGAALLFGGAATDTVDLKFSGVTNGGRSQDPGQSGDGGAGEGPSPSPPRLAGPAVTEVEQTAAWPKDRERSPEQTAFLQSHVEEGLRLIREGRFDEARAHFNNRDAAQRAGLMLDAPFGVGIGELSPPNVEQIIRALTERSAAYKDGKLALGDIWRTKDLRERMANDSGLKALYDELSHEVAILMAEQWIYALQFARGGAMSEQSSSTGTEDTRAQDVVDFLHEHGIEPSDGVLQRLDSARHMERVLRQGEAEDADFTDEADVAERLYERFGPHQQSDGVLDAHDRAMLERAEQDQLLEGGYIEFAEESPLLAEVITRLVEREQRLASGTPVTNEMILDALAEAVIDSALLDESTRRALGRVGDRTLDLAALEQELRSGRMSASELFEKFIGD